MVDAQLARERRGRAVGPDDADLAQRRHGIKCPGGIQRRRRRVAARHPVQAARTVAPARAIAWLATAPTPACAHGTTAPTANIAVCTATPS